MYKMVSEYGNAIRFVKSERQKDRLIQLGYHEEKEIKPEKLSKTTANTKKTSTKRGTKNEKN